MKETLFIFVLLTNIVVGQGLSIKVTGGPLSSFEFNWENYNMIKDFSFRKKDELRYHHLTYNYSLGFNQRVAKGAHLVSDFGLAYFTSPWNQGWNDLGVHSLCFETRFSPRTSFNTFKMKPVWDFEVSYIFFYF